MDASPASERAARPGHQRARLVAVILTRDEQANLRECIRSLREWVDAVVVWDSGSRDATCALARRMGALVVQRPFDNYANQRQAALDSLNAEWVLFVDADERATPALAEEIEQRLAEPSAPYAGYWVARRNFIAGRETRGGGFFPDYQLRLLRRGAARYDPARQVHEIVELDGKAGYLDEPLLHFNYADWRQFHRKQVVYAGYEARMLAERGVRPRPHNFVLQPLREFRRRYVTLGGRRDGVHGLKLAALLAWYYGFVPYWLLLRKRERG